MIKPRHDRDESGVIAVVVAITAVAMFVVAAMVIDLGAARDTRRQSQNAADASALAGANYLYPSAPSCTLVNPNGTKQKPCISDAVESAKDYAQANFDVNPADWTGCTDDARPSGYSAVTGQTACISFDSLTTPHRVRVKIPTRDVKTGLGALAGVKQIPVTSSADAFIAPGAKCGLCFLGTVSTNNTDFSVVAASIAVNGNINAGPNSNWTATSIGVAGSVSGGNYSPAWTGIPPFDDPFKDLALPIDTSDKSKYPDRSDPCADAKNGGGQGVYGSLTIPKGTCKMLPGVYVITGAWGLKNNTLLTSSGGVTLYIKKTGSVDFKNGDVDLTAPTAGDTAGFVLLADRDASNDITLQGNGNTEMTGKVYAKSATFSFNGNSCFGFSGGPVVVNGASSVGNKSCMSLKDASEATVGTGDVALDQ